MIRLKEWMEKKGMSLEEVAYHADLRYATVYSHYTGRTSPKLEMAQKYAKALGIEIQDLLPEE